MPSESKSCIECGKIHKAASGRCRACLYRDQPEQECTSCGATFPAAGSKKCWRCRQSFAPKPCLDCRTTFKGSALRCEPCRAIERTCGCGNVYRDRAHTECSKCRAKERPCDGCGRMFTSVGRRCYPCSTVDRDCTSCGKHFNGAQPLCNTCDWTQKPNYEARLKRSRLAVQRRRAMRLEQAAGCGLIPDETLARIIASSPCVYCGEEATETDHVRPLIAGGLEHESNVAGSCRPCNRSKGPRLLTVWHRTDRVAHGVEHSEIVAAEWARLTARSPANVG